MAEDSLSIKDVWGIYTRAVQDQGHSPVSLQIKKVAMDVFLNLCYKQIKENNELTKIYEMRCLVNTLCQEFMHDILQVTGDTDDEDPTALENYLLKGRGWLLLYVIYKNGVQGLTVGRDFSNLLVTLLPFCLKFQIKGSAKEDETGIKDSLTFQSIGSSFTHMQSSTRWQKTIRQREKAIPQCYRSNNNAKRKQPLGGSTKKLRRIIPDIEKAESSNTDQDIDVGEDAVVKRNRKPLRRRFPSGSRIQEGLSRQDSFQEEENNELTDVLSKITMEQKSCKILDLCSLILNLLQTVCLQDLEQVSLVKVISPSVLPHIVHIYTGMYPSASTEADCLLAADWKTDDSIYFQRQLLRTIMSLCGVIATQQNGVNVILGHKVAQVLLDVAQQLHSLQEIKEQLSLSQNKHSKSDILTDQFLLFAEIVMGLLMCFDVIFQNLPFNIIYIKNAVQLVEEFDEGKGFLFCEEIIRACDHSRQQKKEAQNFTDLFHIEPVKVIGSFLNTLKSVKVNYIHSVTCLKRKHQKCLYCHYFDHHHDILGLPITKGGGNDGTDVVSPTPRMLESPVHNSACLIASWCTFLLDLLPKMESKISQVEILNTLHLSSICCCMKLETFVKSIIQSIESFSPGVQSYALDILNKTILYPYLGAGSADKPSSIKLSLTCLKCSHQNDEGYMETILSGMPSNFDSGFSSTGLKVNDKMPLSVVKSRWSVLEVFRTILFSPNKFLGELTAKHLLILSIEGKMKLKEELFFRVYMQAFESVVGNLLSSPQSSSEEDRFEQFDFSMATKVHCLSALPYLLQVDSVLKTFLTKRGIGNICKLLEDNSLREPILKVFEALVLLDEQRLKNEEFADQEDLDALKGGMVIKAFIDGLTRKTRYDISSKSKIPEACGLSTTGSGDGCNRATESGQNNLALMVDMWETCGKLCVISDKFVSRLQDSPCLCTAENTLLLILQQLINSNKCDIYLGGEGSEDSGQESVDVMIPPMGCYMWLSLLRALLIVCSSCYKFHEHQKEDQITMWKKIHDSFQACSSLPAAKLKTMFDILLSSAMPKKSSILDLSRAKQLSHMYVKEDSIDDDEVRQLLQLNSDDEVDSIMSNEKGYDADTEHTSSDSRRERRNLDHPDEREYFPSVFRLMTELLVWSQNTKSGREILPQMLLKLLQTFTANHTAVKTICQEGLLYDILTGFWNPLISENTSTSVRSSLLSLIQLLAQHRVTSLELQKIQQLLQHPGIPKDLVLSTILSIVENSKSMPHNSVTFPCEKLKDNPQKHKNKSKHRRNDKHHVSETKSDTTMAPLLKSLSTVAMVTTPKMISSENDSSRDDVPKVKQEVWKKAALLQELSDSIPWPPGQCGFTVALWLQVADGHCQTRKTSWSQSSNNVYASSSEEYYQSEDQSQGRQSTECSVSCCLHVLSVGNEDKLLEMWVNCGTGSLTFRLTSERNSSDGLILKEATAKDFLHLDQWHHLVVNYKEDYDKTESQDEVTSQSAQLKGKVTLIIDGWRCQTVWLPHIAIIPSKRFSDAGDVLGPCLCVGHVFDDCLDCRSQVTWSLSSLMLFRGCCITEEESFYLFTQGPSCLSISKCDCTGGILPFTPCLSKHVVSNTRISTDVLVSLKQADLDQLRTSLLLSYNAWNSGKINLFGTLGKPEVPLLLASNLGLTSTPSGNNLLSQHPQVADVIKNGDIVTNTHYILEKALEETGGAEAILFLVAKVFEGHRPDKTNCSEIEQQQAKALQLLFAFVNHSPYIARDYMAANGNRLLTKVLTSSHSIVGYHTLKILMDACTTESLFRHDLDTAAMVMRRKSEAVITNISVMEDLLMNWHVWEKAEKGVLLLMFRALASLIREDHPHQAFNIKQFQSVGIVNKIFLMYEERIQDALPSFSPDIAQSVVSIIQSLMGTPPDVHLIVAMCDFLLHVHPAESTFIKHSKSDFYFSSWWDLPSTKKEPVIQIHRPSHTTDTDSTQTRSSKDSDTSKKWLSETDTYSEDDRSHDTYPEVKVTTGVKMMNGGQTEHKTEEAAGIQVAEDDTDNTQVMPGDKDTLLSFKSKDRDKSKPDTAETVSDLENSDMLDQKVGVMNSPASSVVSGGESLEDKMSSLEAVLVASFSGSSTFLIRSLSEEDGITAPLSNVSFDRHEGEIIIESEVGLTALSVGLLQTLCNVVVTMPDSTTHKVFQKVLKPDILIILAHNNSPEIRTAVLKLLICYLLRASTEQVEDFLRKTGFYLIGAQLYQYPTHTEQAEEVLGLILNHPVNFKDPINIGENLDELTNLQQSSLCLFLSLLEMSVYEDALCYNFLSITFQMFSKSSVVGSLMLEHGLVETLCNMLARINKMPPRPSDIEGIDENDVIIEHIQTIICTVAVREFSASGATHMQKLEEILELLRHLEDKERSKPGDRRRQVLVVRTVQLSIVSSVLQYVEKASQDNKTNNGWFSRQSSSQTSNAYGRTARPLPVSKSQPTLLLTHKYPHHPQIRGASFSSDTKVRMAGPSKFPFLVDYQNEEMNSSSANSDKDSMSSISESWSSNYSSFNRAVSLDVAQSRPAKSGLISSVLESFGRRKRLTVSPVSHSELIDRFKRFLVTAVDLFVYSDKKEVKRENYSRTLNLLFDRPKSESTETTHIRQLFDFLYRAYEMTLSQDRIVPRKPKNTVMWGAKDVTRVQIGRLMVYMMCNKQEFDNRTYTLSYITREVRGKEILRLILTTSPELGTEMAHYLQDLLTFWEDCFNTQQREDAFNIIKIIKHSGIQVPIPMKATTADSLRNFHEEKKSISAKYDKGKQNWQKKHDGTVERILHKNDKLCVQLSTLAMEVTRSVSQFQTIERNKFIEHIKRTMTEGIQIKKSWQQIVQNLTHERAVWFDKKSYPQSWELDPTEGPGRVRKRLKRSHLEIKPRFLKEESQVKLESERVDPPLIYLFEDDHQMSDSAALIYQLYRNEKIQYTCRCTAVSPSSETKGELLIGENSIFFVADEAITNMNYTQVLLGNKDQLSMTWPYEDVREIHKRWFQLCDIGIEIFLTNGKTCILACQNTKNRDDLYQKLTLLELPNLLEMVDLEAIQKSWLEGQMTNYEYLTCLNKIAGRSFNDLMQYPVFPFILNDYTSPTLNLKDAEIYRDLSKPISVQDKSREKKYIDNYEILQQEYERGEQSDISGLKMTPFHYGSHYSNSGTVLHFLIRVPPYTKMFLSYQDENFDIPDRSFHSMETSWRLASFQSTTDVKELIPEFFFFPEFLKNSEGFDFGRRQTGQIVDNVILPPWCKNDPRLFILIHRQVLESDMVTKALNNWIDLVFGYKQQGEEAVKAINVFHPSTYFGLDISKIKENIKRQALKTMIRTYGQTPKQLFTRSPHPQQGQTGGNQGSSNLLMQLFDIGSSSPNSDSDSYAPFSQYIVSAINTVQGLKWGVFLGSPQLPPPKIVWQKKFQDVMASLVALPTGEIIGVGEDSYCATMYSKQKVSTVYASTDVTWAAIISWQYPDGILRINNDKSKPSTNFIQHSPFEQITCVASVPDCRLLFVGGTGGIITVYQTVYNQAKESHIQVRGSKRVLHGHTKAITCLEVCKPFSVLVSASLDHTCIIWDLNRLCYVRSISGHKSGVKAIAVSSTLGDIASVSNKGLGSCLQLHTINASHVASYNCEDTINCLAFSAAPEGRSINVIAGGLSSGCIRLWSSWDLAHLKDLQHESLFAKPIVSLTFTQDSQSLFMSTSDGTVTQWAQNREGKVSQPRFISCPQ